jgi:hypothetical protein
MPLTDFQKGLILNDNGMEPIYETTNLDEASALVAGGQRLSSVDRNGLICTFVFEAGSECREMAHEYFFGSLKCDARLLFDAYKRLKTLIFSKR